MGTNRKSSRKILFLLPEDWGEGPRRMASGVGGAESPLFSFTVQSVMRKALVVSLYSCSVGGAGPKTLRGILSSWGNRVKGPCGEQGEILLIFFSLLSCITQKVNRVRGSMWQHKRLKAQVSSPRIRKRASSSHRGWGQSWRVGKEALLNLCIKSWTHSWAVHSQNWLKAEGRSALGV